MLVERKKIGQEMEKCTILISRQLKNKYVVLIGNHEIACLAEKAYLGGKNQETKNFIVKAIERGDIKLMYHLKGTNIICSHVPLIRENIGNFLNETILKNEDTFAGLEEKIKRLAEIAGFKKSDEGLFVNTGQALLDNNPKEEDFEDFVNIINDLFLYIVNTDETPLIESLLGSLVNGNRMYKNNVSKDFPNLTYAQKLGNGQPWIPEEIGKHTYKEIINIIGHDATPNKEKLAANGKLAQEEYLDKARVLFADEWQEISKARCVKIEVDKEGKKIISFFREEKNDEFVKGNFIEIDVKGNNKNKKPNFIGLPKLNKDQKINLDHFNKIKQGINNDYFKKEKLKILTVGNRNRNINILIPNNLQTRINKYQQSKSNNENLNLRNNRRTKYIPLRPNKFWQRNF